MQPYSSLILIVCSMFLSSSAFGALDYSAVAPLIPPNQDPFYMAPSGFESAAPGTVLRLRQAPGNITGFVANSSGAYNILYRTTDSHYQPTWAVTTVYIPSISTSTQTTGNTTSSGILVSYQSPYDTIDLDDSPSFVFSTAPPADIPALLGNGWFVNSPDYEGPQAAFAAGVNSGHAVIDSLRAVLQVAAQANTSIGLSAAPNIALWGYSGGALASEWALELAQQYAPDLAIAGAALGGLSSNATTFLFNVNKGPFAGLIPAAIQGIGRQWPEFNDYIISRLHTAGPFNAAGFTASRNDSFEQGLAAYAGQDIFNYFLNGSADLAVPLVQSVLNQDGVMGYHGVPQVPLYVYMAIADEIVGVQGADALVERWCGVGVNVTYERNTVGGHLDESTNGDASAMEWLKSVLQGSGGKVPAQPDMGCVVRNVTVNVTDTGL